MARQMDSGERARVRHPILLVGTPPTAGVAVELGEDGVGFLVPRPYAAGQVVDLEMVVPESAYPLRMAVEVVWCEEGGADQPLRYLCGARLRAIGVRDALLLRQHLARLGTSEARGVCA